MKYKRQSAIMHIVRENKLRTHAELMDKLKENGFNVTQATVSRDIKELGIVKVPSNMGTVYALPTSTNYHTERKIKAISDTVLDIESAMHTIVIKTYPGMASAVAASLDNSMKNEFLGSIAGDDVLLIITQGIDDANALSNKLRDMFNILHWFYCLNGKAVKI